MPSGLLSASFIASIYDYGKVPSDRRPSVAFAGRSNVGKSSLINSITMGKNIAKVSQTPGKTQALNFFIVEDKFYLVDLPGYGFAKVPEKVRKEWGKLVEGYLTHDPSLRGLVLLLDCRRELNDDDITMIEWVAERDIALLPVLTKTDKLSRNQLNQKIFKTRKELYGDDHEGDLIAFSTKTNAGKKEVLQWVRKAVS